MTILPWCYHDNSLPCQISTLREAQGSLIPLYYQTLCSYTPLQAGLLLALLGIGANISRTVTNRLTTRWGTRATAWLFITCTVIGTLPFAIPATQDTDRLLIEALELVIRGGGIGALTILTMSALHHQMPAEHIVHVSASSRVATPLGSTLGAAICTALLATTGRVSHATFVYLSALTAVLTITALALPRGQVIRRQRAGATVTCAVVLVVVPMLRALREGPAQRTRRRMSIATASSTSTTATTSTRM